jgi:hypothetical protein
MRASTIGHEHHPIRAARQPYRVSDKDRGIVREGVDSQLGPLNVNYFAPLAALPLLAGLSIVAKKCGERNHHPPPEFATIALPSIVDVCAGTRHGGL